MRALVINCSPVRNGATALIAQTCQRALEERYEVRGVCISDYSFEFCRGCRSCHQTGECVMEDGVQELMRDMEGAQVIVAVSPSYWADIPGQFKAFIDRCTPWSNTHEPHARLSSWKRGYVIALRTGPSMRECERIIGTVEHFYGHLEIASCGGLGLCSVEFREDAEKRLGEVEEFCRGI
ncbi:MAG: flavodoxin family protein [Ruminococcus sp.]|nr:flavodoxin family protein [Ruminococcus sp.]